MVGEMRIATMMAGGSGDKFELERQTLRKLVIMAVAIIPTSACQTTINFGCVTKHQLPQEGK